MNPKSWYSLFQKPRGKEFVLLIRFRCYGFHFGSRFCDIVSSLFSWVSAAIVLGSFVLMCEKNVGRCVPKWHGLADFWRGGGGL